MIQRWRPEAYQGNPPTVGMVKSSQGAWVPYLEHLAEIDFLKDRIRELEMRRINVP